MIYLFEHQWRKSRENFINMVFETLLFENSTSMSFTCSSTWTSERMIFSHYLQLIYMINWSMKVSWKFDLQVTIYMLTIYMINIL